MASRIHTQVDDSSKHRPDIATDFQATRLNEKGLRNDERLERLKLLGLSSPAIVLILIILVIPVGWLFYVSFIGANGQFSLENYERMIDSKSYIRIFTTTFQISIILSLIHI